MTYQPLIISPADNADWSDFLKNKPDLTDVIYWLKNKNLDIENLFQIKQLFNDPEDIFSFKDLKDWALDNDFHVNLSDFDDETIMNYVDEKFSLEDIHGYDKLSSWAEFNDFVSKDKIIDLLSEQINLLNNKDK